MAKQAYIYWAIMKNQLGMFDVPHSISEELDLKELGLNASFKPMDDRAESKARELARSFGFELVAVARQTSWGNNPLFLLKKIWKMVE